MTKKSSIALKEKTFEQMLWGSANLLRGNLDAAEYKNIVLGLVHSTEQIAESPRQLASIGI